MQVNVKQREIVLKVVYYGPPLSGKTTNLQALTELLGEEGRGRLTTLGTADDRTLFFDLLPIFYEAKSKYRVMLKLYTVPGQVVHAATRRLVLEGADGVVFVADSQISEARVNNEYWYGMRQYMDKTGIDAATMPTVVQFNKRDMPNIRTDAELDEIRELSSHPIYTAVAVRHEGVLDTLRGLLKILFKDLNRRYDFGQRFGIDGDEFIKSLLPPSDIAASTTAP